MSPWKFRSNISTTTCSGSRVAEDNNKQVETFPNPVRDMVSVAFYSDKNGHRKIVITDVTGKKVLEQNVLIADGYNHVSVETSTLQTGLYLLHIEGADSQIQEKVMVVRD